jgi:hypothetical protein
VVGERRKRRGVGIYGGKKIERKKRRQVSS